MNNNTFSGGLHLLNTVADAYNSNDLTFGAAGGEIVSAGFSGITAANNLILGAARIIDVRNGVFSLLPDSGKTFTLPCVIKGAGVVLAGYPKSTTGLGTVRLTGDNAQFTGAVHVGYAHLYATDGAGCRAARIWRSVIRADAGTHAAR